MDTPAPLPSIQVYRESCAEALRCYRLRKLGEGAPISWPAPLEGYYLALAGALSIYRVAREAERAAVKAEIKRIREDRKAANRARVAERKTDALADKEARLIAKEAKEARKALDYLSRQDTERKKGDGRQLDNLIDIGNS